MVIGWPPLAEGALVTRRTLLTRRTPVVRGTPLTGDGTAVGGILLTGGTVAIGTLPGTAGARSTGRSASALAGHLRRPQPGCLTLAV
ncbi:hypothetical protein [Streptomyces sp. L2]|uniref:hypothetical protein n=1 Tax=Streptomyces sp. L2 TaxID=2162665 RepID=UPI0013E96103|nr:hypothetical protein [Streptomyces sp. L2]